MESKAFTHLGLFEGIGGFSLAAKWMGWETVAWCEWNEFGQQVLRYHFPEAIGHGDITTTDFKVYANKIDILTGGFPCQPYSSSGKRRGKDDERHLWPEMLRAIREVSPRWIVGENVRGLTNWNGGVVFDEVQADLENEGYEVTPFLLPACAVNAPHRRDRIWFIAHSIGHGHQRRGFTEDRFQKSQSKSKKQERERVWGNTSGVTSKGIIANPFGRIHTLRSHNGRMGRIGEQNEETAWLEFPTEHPVCSGNDGLSDRLDGIAFSKWRKETLKAAGNAIVPQVALQIFKAIEKYETMIDK